MDIDPAGRNQQAAGIEVAARGSGFASHAYDFAAFNRDIAGEDGCPRAVNNRAVANHQIMHLHALPLEELADRYANGS
jgi:hypothetical protein